MAADPHADAFSNGWFTEKSTLWPGQGMSIQVRKIEPIRGMWAPPHSPPLSLSWLTTAASPFLQHPQYDEVLHKEQTAFQDLRVLQTKAFGRILLLDGVIQATDRDEFSYQEMIAHIPLCGLETPAKKVLVVGGGDGGVLRELSRYPELEEIHMAEIDAGVPAASKKFFPQMAIGFNDPRVTLHICDGIKFVQDAAEGTYVSSNL